MRSLFLKLPRDICFYQIEKCIPLEWRQSIKQALDTQAQSKPQFNFDHKTIIGLHVKTDNYMVDCLLTTLKDFAGRGTLSKAFKIFSHIQGHSLASGSCDFIVDSLSSLLLSCTNFKLVSEGKQLHAQVITWGLQKNHALIPKLVSLYAAFGLLGDAHHVVTGSHILHPLPWNILISSYVNKGHFEEAIFAYGQMCLRRIRPDDFTYPSVLKACAEQSNLDLGKEVHRSINASSVKWNLFVQNALVSMYGKCGDLETAQSVFDKMPVKDDVSWNSIISGYASRGKWEEAFELFERMQAAGLELNIITWNTVAGGCLRTGNFKGALQLICQMRMSGHHLDPVAVIIGLGACSHICALKLGKEIHGLAIRNSSIDYNNKLKTLLAGTPSYLVLQWDRSEEATFLFRELLLTDIEPNYVTLAGILPVCARVANLQHGKQFHCYIARREEFQGYLLIWNALIEIYARSGKVSVARRLFDSLDKRDAVTYTSMIAGYGMHGDGKIAVKLFEEMIKSQIKPDHLVMVAILTACSHSGLVAQGQLLFERMLSIYGITPNLEHFACMVDLYGRAGLLKKAKEIILRMPFKPTSEMWATLLGACRIHGNTDIGEWAAEKLLEMKPENSGYYVLIANMYAAAGCWSKLATVRTVMRDLGVRKDPGCAWVDMGAGFLPSWLRTLPKGKQMKFIFCWGD
ncbi:UNVERIFIED_CONTAM: Pentatricopeptide repeat-containing protein [Sesamum angustifolium]|uniref:Pentatricopeptide repeat-containing protein n=1 Tax=Sesamum angustifolium TaxID=2727405 RepID=A0AAW2L5N9_9LAMI